MASSVSTSFLGAIQASLAVLLTISFGVIASRLNILKESSARDISKICVRLFLPSLLITNVGSELEASTAGRYVPVLSMPPGSIDIWALVYTLSSMALGWVLSRAFKFPAWTVPAICFNNTTALPLLLIQSLETAGILSDLTMGPDDSSSDAVRRAKSYFLVSAMVGNSLTFALGPRLLDDEEAPDQFYVDGLRRKKSRVQNGSDAGEGEEYRREDSSGEHHRDESEEQHQNPTNAAGRTAEEQEEHETETTTLLPRSIAQPANYAASKLSRKIQKHYAKLPTSLRKAISFCASLLNAPMVGAILGCIVGLVPPLHRAFFSEPDDGGVFKIWLTGSVKNIGELFATLQLVVVGAKLSSSLMAMKQGKKSGSVPYIPVLTIFFIRFLLWPAISIFVIYAIASRTEWLEKDPILWFVMMLMPTGPSATKLVSMADVGGGDEEVNMSIAKFLTLSYAVSPVICIAVVGSLKATMAVVDG